MPSSEGSKQLCGASTLLFITYNQFALQLIPYGSSVHTLIKLEQIRLARFGRLFPPIVKSSTATLFKPPPDNLQSSKNYGYQKSAQQCIQALVLSHLNTTVMKNNSKCCICSPPSCGNVCLCVCVCVYALKIGNQKQQNGHTNTQ